MAQVTIDGVIDLGAVKPAGAEDIRLDATNGANQIRFRATEDLGGGMSANGTLALRFSPESGRYDGAAGARPIFQGESTVGLSGGFGSFKVGRALTALQGPVNATDPWGTLTEASGAVLSSGYWTAPNAAGASADDCNGCGQARTDGIWYTTPNIGGFTLALTYGFAFQNDLAATAAKRDALTSVWAQYAAGPLMVGGGTEENRFGDKVTAFLATYDLGVVKVGAGMGTVDRSTSTTDIDNMNVMATAPMGAALLKFSYSTSETTTKTRQKIGAGVDYSMSKRTMVYFAYGTDDKRTVEKNGYNIGVKHTF
jgi:predicted porin